MTIATPAAQQLVPCENRIFRCVPKRLCKLSTSSCLRCVSWTASKLIFDVSPLVSGPVVTVPPPHVQGRDGHVCSGVFHVAAFTFGLVPSDGLQDFVLGRCGYIVVTWYVRVCVSIAVISSPVISH